MTDVLPGRTIVDTFESDAIVKSNADVLTANDPLLCLRPADPNLLREPFISSGS
jgi:hypothetical protein